VAAEVEMPFDKEKAKLNLEGILDKFNTDTDIALLHEYHKLYKKEVSLFKRSWAAAWLFMYYDKRETPSPRPADSSRPVGRPADSQRSVDSPRTADKQEKVKGMKEDDSDIKKTSTTVEISLPEEESKMLFISIGKNRRLFPREVITLIMSKCSVAREDIGVIRILDNYSFVQVKDTKADEIIATLTGLKFRGRTLTVNYAKPKSADGEVSK
jgi:hypothetical protein